MLTVEQAFRVDGKVAVITGGGTGLGLAMARCLATAGATVVLVGRRDDVLQKACSEIGEQALVCSFDVAETARAGELTQRVLDSCGRIDILINNAGNQIKKSVQELTVEDLGAQLNLHLQASFALTQSMLPALMESGSGSVIFISSLSAFVGLTNVTGYAVAKSGVMGLVRSFAGELSETGVRFNAIVPGFIDTPMLRKAVENDPHRREKILGRTPMNRFGKPEDIGWAAVYLASEAARFVTGTSLVVDGGAQTGF